MSEFRRRTFLKHSVLGAATAAGVGGRPALQANPGEPGVLTPPSPLPVGRIGKLSVSRLLLGGNLLTHYTHSRDLKYVYNLTAHYNTDAKILETLALAEEHGVNTLVVHTVPRVLRTLAKHRHERGGKISWIICPTAEVTEDLSAYRRQVDQLAEDGVDALYLWGVRADQLVSQGKIDLVRKAVDVGREAGVPSGVGAHDLKVIEECERARVEADFYIKTFHHHEYPTAPRRGEVSGPYAEIPGYWCQDPAAVARFMSGVEKPWIAFKVMAAGAIPPESAFRYVFEEGADHVLAGMFDFEIAEDVRVAKTVLGSLERRKRPWRS